MGDHSGPLTPTILEAIDLAETTLIEAGSDWLFIDDLEDHLSASAACCISTVGTISTAGCICTASTICTLCPPAYADEVSLGEE